MGMLDPIRGQLSVHTELSSVFPAGPRGAGLGGFRPHPYYACGVSMGLSRLTTFALCLLAEGVNILGTRAGLRMCTQDRGSPWTSCRP